MDYQGNSNKGKSHPVTPVEEKSVEQVTTNPVIKMKPSLGQRFKHVFFGGDSRGAARYISEDVILPALRNLLVDSVAKGAERLIYGDSRPTRRSGLSYGSRIQYNSPLMRPDPRGPVRLPDQPPRHQRADPNGLVLMSRDEADMVLERMGDILEKFEVASVADLYDLTGLPVSPIDNKWGWYNLHNAAVRQVREGYLLDLPPAEEI